MNVSMFIGLLVMMINDVTRRNYVRAFGYRPEQGFALLFLMVLLFLTANARLPTP